MFIEKMQYDQDKFYINCFKNLKNNLKNNPEKAEKDIAVNGLWMFRNAVNNGDFATAHELLDLGVFTKYDCKHNPEHALEYAWHNSYSTPEEHAAFVQEMSALESCMKFDCHWDAMLGFAVALKEKELAWKYARKGGRIRRWGKDGEKWTFHQLLMQTDWEDVRNSYRAVCTFDDWKLEYELMLAEIIYDTMKQLTPSSEDDHGNEYQIEYNDPEASIWFRPIFSYGRLYMDVSFYGQCANPYMGPVCLGPSWERFIAMKVDSDYAGMFQIGELVGPALCGYASEFFGFGPSQIRDKKMRRSFAAKLGHLYRKYPRQKKEQDNK